MGNFSRDTFDPSKGYTGVRLQQGVPIVDADWNELNDVIRQEIFDTIDNLYGVWNDGVLPYNGRLNLYAPDTAQSFYENNFYISDGVGLVEGRLSYFGGTYYNQQRYIDPDIAAAEGVEPIPPLTTPTGDRTDAVYLDIWDREVGSDEDPDIINPVIGIETSVRLKREVVVRVAEDAYYHPWPFPRGHRYLMLGRLSRTAGTAAITSDQIVDLRRILIDQSGSYYHSIHPTLFNYGSANAFRNYIGYTYKPSSSSAYGLLPLSLPHDIKMSNFWIRGQAYSSASITVGLYRTEQSSTSLELLAEQTLDGNPFSRTLSWPSDRNQIDNSRYNYSLYFSSGSTGYAYITGIRLYYYI